MRVKIVLFIIMFSSAFTSLSATEIPTITAETDTTLLGLPGDNLDLYAVLDLFQKSKTIEAFEESLNEEKTGINNLDLDLDDEVDFIKVETKQDDDDFMFVLQVDVVDKEVQDVAVILVSKDKEEKVSIQMVGDESLYGENYAIEPKLESSSITANPAYSGTDTTVVKNQESNVVVIESEPIIHYVYSPVYVPYYPPYYYGYYPPYYHPYSVISFNIYFGRNRHHHNHYHGGRNNGGGNTVIINNNNNNYNNYSKTKNTSNTVKSNKTSGSYKSKATSNSLQTGVSKDTKAGDLSKPKTTNKSDISKPTSNPSNKTISKPNSKPTSRPSTPSKNRGGSGRRNK